MLRKPALFIDENSPLSLPGIKAVYPNPTFAVLLPNYGTLTIWSGGLITELKLLAN